MMRNMFPARVTITQGKKMKVFLSVAFKAAKNVKMTAKTKNKTTMMTAHTPTNNEICWTACHLISSAFFHRRSSVRQF